MNRRSILIKTEIRIRIPNSIDQLKGKLNFARANALGGRVFRLNESNFPISR